MFQIQTQMFLKLKLILKIQKLSCIKTASEDSNQNVRFIQLDNGRNRLLLYTTNISY